MTGRLIDFKNKIKPLGEPCPLDGQKLEKQTETGIASGQRDLTQGIDSIDEADLLYGMYVIIVGEDEDI